MAATEVTSAWGQSSGPSMEAGHVSLLLAWRPGCEVLSELDASVATPGRGGPRDRVWSSFSGKVPKRAWRGRCCLAPCSPCPASPRPQDSPSSRWPAYLSHLGENASGWDSEMSPWQLGNRALLSLRGVCGGGTEQAAWCLRGLQGSGAAGRGVAGGAACVGVLCDALSSLRAPDPS